MNHSDAIESNAAEGYLLGDLSEAERDAFELHYFDCSVCTETIRAGAAMFAAGREVAKSPKLKPNVVPFPVRWFNAKAVAAVLAVVVGLQSYGIYLLRRPLPLMAAMEPDDIFITGTMRAGESEIEPIHFHDSAGVKVTATLPSDTNDPSYRLELRDSSGKSLFVIQAKAKKDELHFLLRPLPAGRYELRIEGVQKDGNRHSITSEVIVVQ